MKQYDTQELYTFFTEYLWKNDFHALDIAEQGTGLSWEIIGQGAYNTVFHFDRYPDIVFKVNIGAEYDPRYEYDPSHRAYQAAQYSNLEQYFAEVQLLGEFELDGDFYEAYIQEKMDMTVHDVYANSFEYCVPKNSYKREKKIVEHEFSECAIIQKGKKLLRYCDVLLRLMLVRQYGYQEVERLFDFLCFNHIRDLHMGNWGIDSEGKIRLIDYSI